MERLIRVSVSLALGFAVVASAYQLLLRPNLVARAWADCLQSHPVDAATACQRVSAEKAKFAPESR